MVKIFFEAGPFPFKATPHIFRHTFCRIHLANGVSVNDVADLVGDTPERIRKHYGEWVPERQERLSNAIREAHLRSQKAKWRERVIELPKQA